MAREPVILLRAVEATLIPQGEGALLPEGTWLVLQQSLGGSFTLMTDRGQLVRERLLLCGPLPPPPPTRVVTVPPSATLMLSATATGASLTGVTFTVTVAVSVTPPLVTV